MSDRQTHARCPTNRAWTTIDAGDVRRLWYIRGIPSRGRGCRAEVLAVTTGQTRDPVEGMTGIEPA
jgi:hypothetical protein